MHTALSYRVFLHAVAVPALFLSACICVHAEDKPLRLSTDIVRMDGLTEDDSPVVRRVLMTNVSDRTAILTDVRTSCGCVRASVSRKFLEPGDTATVVIRYNPKDQAGEIDRYVHVYTDFSGDIPSAEIRLAGLVLPTSDPWDLFRVVYGPGLRGRRGSVVFRLSDREREKYIAVVNTSDGELSLSSGVEIPGVSLRTEPEIFKSGEEGKLIISVDSPEILPEKSFLLPLKSEPAGALSSGSSVKVSVKE